jgi:hypothetical protein
MIEKKRINQEAISDRTKVSQFYMDLMCFHLHTDIGKRILEELSACRVYEIPEMVCNRLKGFRIHHDSEKIDLIIKEELIGDFFISMFQYKAKRYNWSLEVISREIENLEFKKKAWDIHGNKV